MLSFRMVAGSRLSQEGRPQLSPVREVHCGARDDSAKQALVAHDRAVARLGRPIWLGVEATFTDATSEAPEWLYEALGDDKLERAKTMLARLAESSPGAAVLRSVGRQYAGEPSPRWSLGLYSLRNGKPIWRGPPDPLLTKGRAKTVAPGVMGRALDGALRAAGCRAVQLRCDGAFAVRIAFRTDGEVPPDDPHTEPRLSRTSVHDEAADGSVIEDSLAAAGTYLVAFGEEKGSLRVELPAFDDASTFLWFMKLLEQVSTETGVATLVLAGYPPPVDETVCWTTITADPAVVEVNMSPATSAAELLLSLESLHAVAESAGLAPFRLHYNGTESDSGGGGQVTLGGPRPEMSPFLLAPNLLPQLVRFFNRHPSLSYLHAPDSAGSASQAPRADESVRESFRELELAVSLIERAEEPSPEIIWSTLAPFLSDPSGNTHRAEINIEKLWNASLGLRGRQGLVEFRALRMGATPGVVAALAALLRALVAMLAERIYREPLIDWGDTLHDRFALPFFLVEDMRGVLAELASHDLALGEPLERYLLDDGHRLVATRTLPGCRLEIRRALEFWPLVGDVAAQEHGGSRLVDASTSRIEVRLRQSGDESDFRDWRISALGWDLPLNDESDAAGPVRLIGLRYRSFVPWRGLHPTLPAQAPISLTVAHPVHGAWCLKVHEWRPDGDAYAGLPTDHVEARARRDARCVLEHLEDPPPESLPPPPAALGDHVVDLRWR